MDDKERLGLLEEIEIESLYDTIVWDTKKIELVKKYFSMGKIDMNRFRVNPFRDKNINKRAPFINFKYTDKEIYELVKCKTDIFHFAENYIYVKHKGGDWKPIKLRDYQKQVLKAFVENKNVIFLASRQIGKCLFPIGIIQGKYGNINVMDLYYNHMMDVKKNIKGFKRFKFRILLIFKKLLLVVLSFFLGLYGRFVRVINDG